MKRRGPFIAVAVAAVALVTVGLGAYRGEAGSTGRTSDEICEDLSELFEGYCKPGLEKSDCATVTGEYGDACQAGCVLGLCPEKVPCTALDPIWCASCNDMKGARFWADLDTAAVRCEDSLRRKHQGQAVDFKGEEFRVCFQARMETNCPALAGSDWHARWKAATGQ